MARRRGKAKATRMKAEDTHRFLRFVLTHNGDEDFHYVDIAQIMSQINRRLYRQGGTYHVANITVHDSQGDAYVKFAGLPTTWTTKAAWTRGFELWKKQRAQVQDDGLRLSGKWSDFKVYLNDDHRTDGDKAAFTDVENNLIASGEWDYADYVLQDGSTEDGFFFHMMGADNGSLVAGNCVSAGLLNALNLAMSIPQDDPNPPSQAAAGLFGMASFNGMDKDLAETIIDYAADDNNSPPYSTKVAGMAGNCEDPWEYREVAIKSSQSPSAMIPGFAVPLGLLCIETKSGTEGNEIGIVLELAPGSYKGVQFESWA